MITNSEIELAKKNLSCITNANKYAVACQVRTNIRFNDELPYQVLVQIFKNKQLYKHYKKYVLSFFEECYPSLIKKMMQEQNVDRKEVIDIFNMLAPTNGELFDFRKAIDDGQF